MFFWTKLFPLPRNPKNILVIRLDHAGDMVMALPVFASLRSCFPETQISVLCRSFLKDFVGCDKNVDAVFAADVPWFCRESSDGWLKTLKLLWSLRKKFDLVIELHSDPRNIIAAFLIGGFRIGYGVRGFGFLLNKVVKFNSHPVHMIKQNLRVIESLDCRLNDSVLLPSLDGAGEKIKEFLKKQSIKRYVVVHPVAARNEKLWLNDRWATFVDTIINQYHLPVLLTGAVVEWNLVEDIRNRVSDNNKKFVVNACTVCDNLLDLVFVVKNSTIVISVDTVAVHFAHALKVPVVGLYGSTNPVVWGYDDKKSISVYKIFNDKCGVDCRKEAHRMRMMKEISVGDVLSAVKKLQFV